NTYAAAPAEAMFSGTKSAVGAAIQAGQFEFGVFDENGGQVVAAANDAAGNITFPASAFDSVGIYNYTIGELTPSGGGWTTDATVYLAEITVTDDGSGTLSAQISYPNGAPDFVNTYSAAPASAVISAYKQLLGWSGAEIPFNFVLSDQNGNPVSAATNQNGAVEFPPLSYSAPGTYNYTIAESSPGGNGWTTDTTIYPAVVTVTENGQGQLSALVTYPNGTPTFVNTYAPETAYAYLTAAKTAVGAVLPDGQFRFAVFNSNGQQVSSAFNDANGNIVFPSISFNAAGTYTYTIRETTPSGGGWTTDRTSYTAVITVADNGSGQLAAHVSYPGGAPAFVNTYGSVPPPPPPPPSPAEVILQAKKTLSGARLTAKLFTLGVFDASGHELVRAENDADGNVTFPAFAINKPGVYSYTIRELNPSACGWVTDKRSYTVTVTVTYNGCGRLTAQICYPNGTPTFANSYSPPGTCSIGGCPPNPPVCRCPPNPPFCRC
ncbi:MAG: hypothetical protein LBT21_01540, partial [Oscillospiraceae bacterium]|nr:hypothetical protein [Oscillospiraceae bacterium]